MILDEAPPPHSSRSRSIQPPENLSSSASITFPPLFFTQGAYDGQRNRS